MEEVVEKRTAGDVLGAFWREEAYFYISSQDASLSVSSSLVVLLEQVPGVTRTTQRAEDTKFISGAPSTFQNFFQLQPSD